MSNTAVAPPPSQADAAEALDLRYVVYQDRGWWVAQCLERNLCAGAPDFDDLAVRVSRQLRTQLWLDEQAGRAPLSGLGPAPARFWRMADGAAEAPSWSEMARKALAELEALLPHPPHFVQVT